MKFKENDRIWCGGKKCTVITEVFPGTYLVFADGDPVAKLLPVNTMRPIKRIKKPKIRLGTPVWISSVLDYSNSLSDEGFPRVKIRRDKPIVTDAEKWVEVREVLK